MTTVTALIVFDTVVSILADSRETIDDINKAYAAKGLSLAFTVGDDRENGYKPRPGRTAFKHSLAAGISIGRSNRLVLALVAIRSTPH